MYQHFLADRAALYHTAVGSEISAQYRNSSCLAVWVLNGTDNFGVLVNTAGNVFADGLAGCSHAVKVQQIFLGKLVHYRVNAARFVKFLNIGVTCGSKVAEIGSLRADVICNVKIDVYSAFVCNCRQVEHTVCGAAQSHIYGKSVHKRLFRHDVKGFDVLFKKLHNLHSRVLCKLYTL